MKNLMMVLLTGLMLQVSTAQTNSDKYPFYNGKDLGLTYTKASSTFKVWSPVAEAALLLLYKDGAEGTAFKTINLKKSTAGVWSAVLQGNWKGTYYTCKVKINNQWSNEITDPYTKATGVNGRRGVVIDLKETDPAGWTKDRSPSFSNTNSPVDAVIYELHIRDASIDMNSGIKHKGKFAGLAETGTVNNAGQSTGLDHLKELDVTHVHLLPFFDYNSVDESKPEKAQYNWGYDPLNYNVPEGSYSTNANDCGTRIKELKEMIAAFHQKGLRVVMDVVYNHTAQSQNSNFNQLAPDYYYRLKKDGSFSNATACGNETASEMPMMQKFMLESVLYWAKEYHLDGFRFDLMGVHDIATMNKISDALYKIKPDILLYGEGWAAGQSSLPDSVRALKKNVAKLRHIAVFSDDIRDAIKGSVFEEKDRGFASGKPGMEESVKFGIVAACQHPQVDYNKVNYSKGPYASSPASVITYCECHDNNALWDKLALSCPESSEADRKKMHELALAIVLTSQGIPFLHAGTEFLRNKKGVENSYNSGDSINAIDWSLKTKNFDVNSYVKKLVEIRKQHPAFRMQTSKEIQSNIHFDEAAPQGTIVYTINGAAVGDSWKKIWIALNGSAIEKEIKLPKGNWKVAIGSITGEKIAEGMFNTGKYSAAILYMD